VQGVPSGFESKKHKRLLDEMNGDVLKYQYLFKRVVVMYIKDHAAFYYRLLGVT